MAKRFVDTELDDKPWFNELSCRLKCAAQYIFRKCDNAGIWEPNYKIGEVYIGEPFYESEILQIDSGRQFQKLENGKIFVVGFCDFQYGKLSEDCKPHRPIIQKLKKAGLYERVLKGYQKGIENLEEKEKDKEKEKETEKEKDKGGVGEKYIVPQMQKVFKSHITAYLPDKEKDYRPLLSIANFLCQQANVRGGPENNQQQILEAWDPICAYIATDKFYGQKSLTTISNHIQEIVQKAIHGDKSTTSTAKTVKLSADKIKDAINRRTG